MNEGASPSTPSAALQRLALSRERLRAALREANGDLPDGRAHPPSPLMNLLLSIPGARIVIDAVRNWWAGHPMHFAGIVASQAAHSVVRPMARRNPYTLMALAMVAGGLVFWFKPWRGLLKPALLAGLLPQLISRAVAHVPMESWLSALLAMANPGHRPAHDDTAEAGSPAAAAATAPAQPTAATPEPTAAAPSHRAPAETLH
jgi:hypothetical protein